MARTRIRKHLIRLVSVIPIATVGSLLNEDARASYKFVYTLNEIMASSTSPWASFSEAGHYKFVYILNKQLGLTNTINCPSDGYAECKRT